MISLNSTYVCVLLLVEIRIACSAGMRDNVRARLELDRNHHQVNSKGQTQRKQVPPEMSDRPQQLKSLNRQKSDLPQKIKKLSPVGKRTVLPRIARRTEQGDQDTQQGIRQQNNLAIPKQSTVVGINRPKVQGPSGDLGGREATLTGITRQPMRREKGASCSNFMIDNAQYAQFSRFVGM